MTDVIQLIKQTVTTNTYGIEDMTETEALEKLSEVLHLSADVVDELKNNGAEYLDGQTEYNTAKLPRFDELSDNPF